MVHLRGANKAFSGPWPANPQAGVCCSQLTLTTARLSSRSSSSCSASHWTLRSRTCTRLARGATAARHCRRWR